MRHRRESCHRLASALHRPRRRLFPRLMRHRRTGRFSPGCHRPRPGPFYSPAVDLALGWHYHVSYGNTNAHCCVADLHRRIKIIPPVYVEVPLIAWQAVQIFGIAKYLVTMTKHICFVLCDLFHYLFYSSVIQCAPCEARPNQIHTNTKKEGISIHTPRMGRDCRLPLQLVAHPAMPSHPSRPHSLHSGSAAVC